MYKRPSTLCLPVACQPDPAVGGGVRRLRKLQPQRYYDTQTIYTPTSYNLNRRHSVSTTTPQQQMEKKRQQQLLQQQQQQQIDDLEFEKYLAGQENTRENLVNKVFKYARGLKPKVNA